MYCWFKIFEMQLELVCTQGDDGGPLTVVLKGKHVLVGAVGPRGSDCGTVLYLMS